MAITITCEAMGYGNTHEVSEGRLLRLLAMSRNMRSKSMAFPKSWHICLSRLKSGKVRLDNRRVPARPRLPDRKSRFENVMLRTSRSNRDLPDDWLEQVARHNIVMLRASSDDLVAAAIHPSPAPPE